MADKIVSPKVRATLARVHESFPKFDKLPIELRNMIWKVASYEPRFVKFEGHTTYTIEIAGGFRYRFEGYELTSLTSHPALLHTCQEAQAEGLRHYQRYFCDGRGFFLYLNLDVDVLCPVGHFSPAAFQYFWNICLGEEIQTWLEERDDVDDEDQEDEDVEDDEYDADDEVEVV